MSKGDYEYDGFRSIPEIIGFTNQLGRRLRKYFDPAIACSVSNPKLPGYDQDKLYPTKVYHASTDVYQMFESGVDLEVLGGGGQRVVLTRETE